MHLKILLKVRMLMWISSMVRNELRIKPQTKFKAQFNQLMQLRQGVLFALFHLVYSPNTILMFYVISNA